MNFGKGRDVEQESFEALRHVATVGEGLEETLKDLRRQTTLLAPAFVIISDYKEEEHVERRALEKEEQVQ
jgi:hypothetical protein